MTRDNIENKRGKKTADGNELNASNFSVWGKKRVSLQSQQGVKTRTIKLDRNFCVCIYFNASSPKVWLNAHNTKPLGIFEIRINRINRWIED